ncbi:putative polygalacturonase [Camellia lanceoleosa]|uniref:Polygalacturonase n=1 Tax=Camellia lanceoleosa TaxID=1840588 RepID=A0ACC0HWD4_9ERIC|nr:putative polygalacturonase [Camellia lanceoleosa]
MAFLKVWKAVCQAESVVPILVIPRMTFLLKPATFSGPCKSSNIFVQVLGNLVAPNTKWAWIGHHINTWLTFSNVSGLSIIGQQGRIDGQGSAWWPQPCLQQNVQNGAKCNGPTALTFDTCNDLQLNGLAHINSPRNHMTVKNCNGVVISNLHIIATETSPNTDGIDIPGSTNIQIGNSNIKTGDDCIAISGGSSNISITGVTCGPGHGISIGALGYGGYDRVEGIHVSNCTFKGTMNGVRIKTWQGGNGYARKISFENIKLVQVNNPILIDQFYCPSRVDCQNKTSAVELSDISYSGIMGTSTADEAINLSCSQSGGGCCTDISLDRVYIASTIPGKKTNANCFNAHGRSTHTKPTVKCLMQ